MRVITVSRTFPGYHPKAGEPTYFVEKIWAAMADEHIEIKMHQPGSDLDFYKYYNAEPKRHTIRSGDRWKVGDMASLRYWQGKPRQKGSKQIEFAQVEIKQVWPIKIVGEFIFNQFDNVWFAAHLDQLSANDGLSVDDLKAWFKMPVKTPFIGQIICWSDKVNY